MNLNKASAPKAKYFIVSILLYIWTAIFIISCTNPSRLDKALLLSGENRNQLEQVITHYSQSEKDSLHLKAALFLIENMPGHYEASSPFLTAYQKSMDSLYPNMSSMIKSAIYSIPIEKSYSKRKQTKKEDIKNITASYLINHVDNAIAMWQTCPWLTNCSFSDFCEYLLPYRITNEPLIQPDSTKYLWKSICNEMDYYHYIPQTLNEVLLFQREITMRDYQFIL